MLGLDRIPKQHRFQHSGVLLLRLRIAARQQQTGSPPQRANTSIFHFFLSSATFAIMLAWEVDDTKQNNDESSSVVRTTIRNDKTDKTPKLAIHRRRHTCASPLWFAIVVPVSTQPLPSHGTCTLIHTELRENCYRK